MVLSVVFRSVKTAGWRAYMTQLVGNSSRQIASSSLSNPWRFLDFLHAESARVRTFTAVAVALAWVPALLSALRGRTVLLSLLTDYATQNRFLIVLPLLILVAPGLNKRLEAVRKRCRLKRRHGALEA